MKITKKLILLGMTGLVLLKTQPFTEKVEAKIKVESENPDVPKMENPSLFKNEDEVMTYFENLKNDIITLTDEGKQEDIVDQKMMTYLEFLFHDQELGGYYLTDLTLENQIQIKTDFLCVREYVSDNQPKWYERLKETSSEVKDYLVEGYQTIKKQLQTWDEEGTLKENIKNELSEMWENDKENLSNAWETTKQFIKKW